MQVILIFTNFMFHQFDLKGENVLSYNSYFNLLKVSNLNDLGKIVLCLVCCLPVVADKSFSS